MSKNESFMRRKGMIKVKKEILTKNGGFKKISSTQIGQKIIFDEAIRILPEVKKWIKTGSANTYRRELLMYFNTDEIILEKITQSFLILAGEIYNYSSIGKNVSKTRHKKLDIIRENTFPELSFENSWRFLEVAISLSKYFFINHDTVHKADDIKINVSYTCTISDTILEKIAKDVAEAFYPLPMTEPPTPWHLDEEGKIVGGYNMRQYEMIRSYVNKVDYTKYSQNIFDAVNYIQSVPWEVNVEVLKILKRDLKEPEKKDFIKSEYPDDTLSRWDIDIKDINNGISPIELISINKARADFLEKVEIYKAEKRDFESALGKYRSVKMAVKIAEDYVGETLYFPHSYDSRGRVYPISIGLSPQGSDSIKALLLYKNNKPHTKRGMDWNWAYLASLYGEDKLDFIERVRFGKTLLKTSYLEADEPYQFLAHQIEMNKYAKDNSYNVRTRIHLDACNSGSQITSAITGDKDGCIATNVIPSFSEDGNQIRKDAYLLVANKALELNDEMINLEEDRDKKSALKYFKKLLLKNGRKICKTPVMVSNYGGTAGGRADILWNLLREFDAPRKYITKKNASLYGKVVGDSIVGVLNGGKAFEKYIHAMNNIIAKEGKPVWWTTSDGFHVVHVKNKEMKPKRIQCSVPGSRGRLTLLKKIYSKQVSHTKMKSAISPNYVHSLDAELLRRTALRMRDEGIVDSDWIHDSFGCHANDVDLMLKITKDVFCNMMNAEPLLVLDNELRSQISDKKESQKALSKVILPNLGGFNVNKGDLDVVRRSNWFFS